MKDECVVQDCLPQTHEQDNVDHNQPTMMLFVTHILYVDVFSALSKVY